MEIDWAALGTWAAVVLALVIALRERVLSRADRMARAKSATIMLWPDFRRLQAGLNRLSQHEVLLVSGQLENESSLELSRIVGLLSVDLDRVLRQVQDLDGEHGLAMARVMANVRHALRHTNDIKIADGALRPEPLSEKQAAIQTAIRRAKTDLKPLLAAAKRLKNHGP